jgi:hypothetical protein
MVQYSTALAVGSTAGTAAGKRLSNALTAAMSQAAKTSETAAETPEKALVSGPPKPGEYQSTVPPAKFPRAAASTADSHASGPRKAATTRRSTPGEVHTADLVALPEIPAPVAAPILPTEQLLPPPPPQPSIEERLAQIAAGASRDEVRQLLGRPQSSITIPQERGVNEIYYYYSDSGRMLAKLNLEAGIVTRVLRDGI